MYLGKHSGLEIVRKAKSEMRCGEVGRSQTMMKGLVGPGREFGFFSKENFFFF